MVWAVDGEDVFYDRVVHVAEAGEGAVFVHLDHAVVDDRIVDIDADDLAEDDVVFDLGVAGRQARAEHEFALECCQGFFDARWLHVG